MIELNKIYNEDCLDGVTRKTNKPLNKSCSERQGD